MKKGFTLVEVMIVVAIIGLLAAIGIPSIMNALSKAEEKTKARNIASVEKAKAMLQLPSNIHAKGQSMAVGDVAGITDIAGCIQGVDDLADLTVAGTALVGTDDFIIGTTAEY